MRLLISIGPVTKTPRGTTTLPPPAFAHASMAAAIASVLSVAPSPRAPWSVMRTVFDGIRGSATGAIGKGRSAVSVRGSSIAPAAWTGFTADISATRPKNPFFRADEIPQFTGTLW